MPICMECNYKFQFYNLIFIFTKQLVYMINCFSYVQRKEFI